jgi:hypothetical protein
MYAEFMQTRQPVEKTRFLNGYIIHNMYLFVYACLIVDFN